GRGLSPARPAAGGVGHAIAVPVRPGVQAMQSQTAPLRLPHVVPSRAVADGLTRVDQPSVSARVTR
ncbi:hypothetical protein ACWGJ6_49610, partial [Streptomyces canus]